MGSNYFLNNPPPQFHRRRPYEEEQELAPFDARTPESKATGLINVEHDINGNVVRGIDPVTNRRMIVAPDGTVSPAPAGGSSLVAGDGRTSSASVALDAAPFTAKRFAQAPASAALLGSGGAGRFAAPNAREAAPSGETVTPRPGAPESSADMAASNSALRQAAQMN